MARKPGRPRVDPRYRSVPVCVTVPANQYDALYVRAQRERVSVPEVIRRWLVGNKNIQTST